MVRKNIPVNNFGKDLSTQGGRLAAERTRVKLTVVDFALQCGVTKQTQIKYEADQNFPDTRYLTAALSIGVDIMYVLTGIRCDALQDEHQNLIDAYEAAPDILKRAAFAVLVSEHKPVIDHDRFAQTVSLVKEVPGYMQHEVLGEADVRYSNHDRGNTGKKPEQLPPPEAIEGE